MAQCQQRKGDNVEQVVEIAIEAPEEHERKNVGESKRDSLSEEEPLLGGEDSRFLDEARRQPLHRQRRHELPRDRKGRFLSVARRRTSAAFRTKGGKGDADEQQTDEQGEQRVEHGGQGDHKSGAEHPHKQIGSRLTRRSAGKQAHLAYRQAREPHPGKDVGRHHGNEHPLAGRAQREFANNARHQENGHNRLIAQPMEDDAAPRVQKREAEKRKDIGQARHGKPEKHVPGQRDGVVGENGVLEHHHREHNIGSRPDREAEAEKTAPILERAIAVARTRSKKHLRHRDSPLPHRLPMPQPTLYRKGGSGYHVGC